MSDHIRSCTDCLHPRKKQRLAGEAGADILDAGVYVMDGDCGATGKCTLRFHRRIAGEELVYGMWATRRLGALFTTNFAATGKGPDG
ncbi:MAG: hypothetical protein GX422_01035 [Deltaproteobacteria bacterium]|jgi:hypothetical protein|nr:hypothetical protein [Deltaproteobacteria bacterium]